MNAPYPDTDPIDSLAHLRQDEWNSKVFLHPYQILQEPNRRPLISYPQNKAILEVEPEALCALSAIREHPLLSDAHKAILDNHGLDLDLPEFVTHLTHLGFVRMVNQVPFSSRTLEKQKKTHFAGVSEKTVAWMHAPWFLASCLVIVFAAALAVFQDRALLPTHQHLLFTENPLVIILGSVAFVLGNAYLHELAHLFMARSYGIDANISFSRRYHIIILRTDVSNAWTLPGHFNKCLIFLAGMGFNLVSASTVILLAALAKSTQIPLATSLTSPLLAIAFLNTIPLRFQLLLWIRTDLYYVLMILFNHRSLQEDSKRFLGEKIDRWWRAILHLPRIPCDACTLPNYWGAPRCQYCGEAQPRHQKGTIPPQTNAKPLLVAYAIISVAILPLFLLVAVGSIAGGVGLLITQTLAFTVINWETHAWADFAAGAISLALLTLQAMMIMSFAAPNLATGAVRGLLRIWQIFRWSALLLSTPSPDETHQDAGTNTSPVDD